MDGGDEEGDAPNFEKEFKVFTGSLVEPGREDRQDKVDSDEHIEVPEGRGVIVEVDGECQEFVNGRGPCICSLREAGVGRLDACLVKVQKVEKGEG